MLRPDEIQLETPRLWLRSMRADDTDALLTIFADPAVMAAFNSPPFTQDQMARWVRRNLTHQTTYGYGLFTVILKNNGLVIGDCGLELMELDGLQVAELGYDFRSDHWNQGYATEAATAVHDYAFQQLRLPRLISLIRVGNHASRRVAEKIGMRLVEEYSRYETRYWKFSLVRPDSEE